MTKAKIAAKFVNPYSAIATAKTLSSKDALSHGRIEMRSEIGMI